MHAVLWFVGGRPAAKLSLNYGDCAMAHREQHGNREAKKPKNDKESRSAEGKKWDVTQVVEAKATSKHQTLAWSGTLALLSRCSSDLGRLTVGASIPSLHLPGNGCQGPAMVGPFLFSHAETNTLPRAWDCVMG